MDKGSAAPAYKVRSSKSEVTSVGGGGSSSSIYDNNNNNNYDDDGTMTQISPFSGGHVALGLTVMVWGSGGGCHRREGHFTVHALSLLTVPERIAQLTPRKCRVCKGACSQSVVSVWQHTLGSWPQQGFLYGSSSRSLALPSC